MFSTSCASLLLQLPKLDVAGSTPVARSFYPLEKKRSYSDPDDANFLASCRDEALDVSTVARHDVRHSCLGNSDQSGITDVAGSGFTEEGAHLMGGDFIQGDDFAAPQHSAELDLLRRPACLRQDRRWDVR